MLDWERQRQKLMNDVPNDITHLLLRRLARRRRDGARWLHATVDPKSHPNSPVYVERIDGKVHGDEEIYEGRVLSISRGEQDEHVVEELHRERNSNDDANKNKHKGVNVLKHSVAKREEMR